MLEMAFLFFLKKKEMTLLVQLSIGAFDSMVTVDFLLLYDIKYQP